MTDKHIQKKLSAYLNHELPKEERQAVAEHLLQCEKCRNEHDGIKLGAILASRLKRADAPENLWREIERNLNGREKSKATLIPQFSLFNSHRLAVACMCFGFVSVLVVGIVNLYFRVSPEVVENKPTVNQTAKVEIPQTVSTPTAILTNQNANIQSPSNIDSNFQTQPVKANSNAGALPKTNPAQPRNKSDETIKARNDLPAWNVETIAGMPKSGNQTIMEKGKLALGEILETDANSRAKIEVADIGQVEIAPNSRVQLVNTNPKEHRLSLKKGILSAKIYAPPRLFIVDTPTAVAVDLGCEYTLEVDAAGNSKLHVTSGFVALENGGRESIVPAGAICLTRKGAGLGTPFFDDVSADFRAAVRKFDFENGGAIALDTIFREARTYDTLTLWHLLWKTNRMDRERVFDKLVSFVKLPPGATREGVLKSDKKMLEMWRAEIENLWFE